MLLWICDPSEIKRGIPPLLTQSSLLAEFDSDVIDNSTTLSSLQNYFTPDTWMAVLQRGRFTHSRWYNLVSLARLSRGGGGGRRESGLIPIHDLWHLYRLKASTNWVWQVLIGYYL